MEIILPKISSSLSKMWTKVLNLENSLFPSLKRELQLEELSNKEQKLIKGTSKNRLKLHIILKT
jgi:hypothetical protein